MPELPEVETIKRDLEKVIIGKEIIDIYLNNPKVIKEPSAEEFKKMLLNTKFRQILRRGKLLVFKIETNELNTYFLTVHLRIAGQLVLGNMDAESRLSLRLSDDKFLNYNDSRLLGELKVRKDWRDLDIIKNMGPEPLSEDFSLTDFKRILAKRKTNIKSFLMDQSAVAGIGNIYAAEILFISGISPLRITSELSGDEIEKLFKNIKNVLQDAIKYRGCSVDNYRDGYGNYGSYNQRLFVYGRKGERCFKCNLAVNRIVLGGRGTYFCPQCQK